METTHKQIVLGILAHVDSGKTTLSEAMLYRSGAIRKLGRVDHKDAFLDTDTLEKARGITIFSKQALLTAGNTDITLLDTPGHVDFSTASASSSEEPATITARTCRADFESQSPSIISTGMAGNSDNIFITATV